MRSSYFSDDDLTIEDFSDDQLIKELEARGYTCALVARPKWYSVLACKRDYDKHMAEQRKPKYSDELWLDNLKG